MKSKCKRAGSIASKPTFIHPLEIDGDQVQVSFRLAASEKIRFEAAQATLRKHDLDMSLVDVLRAAIRDVTCYVEQAYSSNAIDIRDQTQQVIDTFGMPEKVQHTTTGSVEEWEASGDVDDKSTSPIASPLKGSSVTEEHSGVGSITDGGKDGAR